MPVDNDGLLDVSLMAKDFPGKDKNGKKMPVFDLVPAAHARLFDRGAESMRVYWCKFGTGETFSVILGTAAEFMFTTKMDGCTFGIGSEAPDGTVLVCHANRTGVNAIARAAQMESVTETLGTVTATVSPVNYRDQVTPGRIWGEWRESIRSATTIGQRINGHWVFYAQVYKNVGPVSKPDCIFCEIQDSTPNL